MLFDPFTVIVQIINFLILLLLLRRFLYGPIIKAMNAREAKIAAELAEAEQAKQQAVEEIERYREQNRALREQQDALLFAAKTEAEAWRQKTIATARLEIEEARAQWYDLIRQEKAAFLQDVRTRTARQVYAISRRALADLANADLEQRIIHVFMDQIRNLDAAGQARIAQAISEAGEQVLIRSAFPILPEAQQEIAALMQEIDAGGAALVFETKPDLVCGIEARIQSHKIAWTLDNYLTSLEEELFATLAEETEQSRDPAPIETLNASG